MLNTEFPCYKSTILNNALAFYDKKIGLLT